MNASDFVHLNGGLTLPLEALRLAWDLEDRGLRLRVDGDALVVGPRAQLTETDRRAIARWKAHLIALTNYEAPEVH